MSRPESDAVKAQSVHALGDMMASGLYCQVDSCDRVYGIPVRRDNNHHHAATG